jgi:hypothetical protein
VKELFKHSGSDIVVQNDLSDRNEKNEQLNFNVYNTAGKLVSIQNVKELGGKLEDIIFTNPG